MPWRRAWQPIPVLLPGESHGPRSYSPKGPKELDTIIYTHTHTHTHTHTGSRTHRLQELWHRGSVVSPGPRAQAHVSGTWASLISSTWDLPGSGIKPMSPELASGFFTTEPPVKPLRFLNIFEFCKI